ncbi:hypothetical protein GPJ56_010257 [Histomonas meleagridis]|uniref:uncharacterized protein n=1 Tax=Histomonas meleagridis TaxID=135588 RepID=UPI00355AB5F5|nr:hypothetical protein GPJ56_010257 [Histomonas meleagridis]KAH0797125.1 hypothetical protein GO595_011018 [Histomonas meleagridis]
MENTEPILSVVRTQDNPIGRGISRDFTENPFVSPLFSTQTFQYTLSIPPPPTLPFPKKISNDYDIPEGNSEMANNIEKQAIQQFLQRSEKRDEETMTFSFSTISSVCKSQVPWKFGIKSPPIGYSLPLKYLQVKLKSMSYANQKSDITDFQGTLFLYASKRHQYLSESLRFTRTLNSTVFEHTSTDTCYFEVQPPSEDIYLVCVLMHQSAYSLDNFLKALTGERPIPQQQFASVIPFAFSYIPLYSLFTKSGEVDLTFPVWIKYSSSEHFKYIGCEVTPPEVQTLPINSSVNLVVMTDKEIPINLSQTGEIQMPKSPIMALSVPFLLHPKPSIMLSGIHMKFNSLPKCEFLYFKVFYCEDPRDPVNPTGMKVFLPKNDDGSSSNCFTSKPIPVSKKPIFTDCVRMVLDKPLKSTSHLVIHINSIQKSGLSTLRIVIVPLIIENNPIQTSTQTYTMISSKRLKPNEYLSKLNANGKKSLKMNIDTTSIFFVPKTLNTLSNAIVPQQINLKEILEVPVKTIRQQFIPISSKLLSLSSSTSLQALIEIYQYCKSEIRM